jgi:hypothetical protein
MKGVFMQRAIFVWAGFFLAFAPLNGQTTTISELPAIDSEDLGSTVVIPVVDPEEALAADRNKKLPFATLQSVIEAALTAGDVGLGNVDNTADADKPVSTATQTALDLKLNLTGGSLSGTLNLNGNTLEDPSILGGVLGSELDAMGFKISGLDDGTASDDAATKGQLDAAAAAITASSLGLGNVDNTADADKPVSDATAARLRSGRPTAESWKDFERCANEGVILGDTSNNYREPSVVWYDGAFVMVVDSAPNTNPYVPDSFSHEIRVLTTTDEPQDWSADSWTDEGIEIAKGTSGQDDDGGCVTPSLCVIGDRLWCSYTGHSTDDGSGDRVIKLAYSDDGVTFTKSAVVLDTFNYDDSELIYDEVSGRTYLIYSRLTDSPRVPYMVYTDDADLATATWSAETEIYNPGVNALPHSAWITESGALRCTVSTRAVIESRDGGSTWEALGTVAAPAGYLYHLIAVHDRTGVFAGWLYNEVQSGLAKVRWNRRLVPEDYKTVSYVLATGATSGGNLLIKASDPKGFTVTGARWVTTSTLAASGTDYWSFELRMRGAGGATSSSLIQDSQSGNSSYVALEMEDVPFDVTADYSLQAFWAKTGSPANITYLTVEMDTVPLY